MLLRGLIHFSLFKKFHGVIARHIDVIRNFSIQKFFLIYRCYCNFIVTVDLNDSRVITVHKGYFYYIIAIFKCFIASSKEYFFCDQE